MASPRPLAAPAHTGCPAPGPTPTKSTTAQLNFAKSRVAAAAVLLQNGPPRFRAGPLGGALPPPSR